MPVLDIVEIVKEPVNVSIKMVTKSIQATFCKLHHNPWRHCKVEYEQHLIGVAYDSMQKTECC
jgi:hypothetical protein